MKELTCNNNPDCIEKAKTFFFFNEKGYFDYTSGELITSVIIGAYVLFFVIKILVRIL